VIDAERDRPAQDVQRLIAVPRRPEDSRPGELHRAVPHPVNGVIAERRRTSEIHAISPYSELR
jgi:hypothetical protein